MKNYVKYIIAILLLFFLGSASTVMAWKVFSVLDDSGANVAIFDDRGNLLLKGTMDPNTTHTATAEDEFIIEDLAGNELAIIDASDGNMYIDGTVYEDQVTLSPSSEDDNFIIEDSSGNTVAYIDNSGDLYLKGVWYEDIFTVVGKLFSVLDNSGANMAVFDDFGNLFLKGTMDPNTTHTATAEDEFIIEDSADNELAVIDASDGNMYIDGTVYEDQVTLSPSSENDNFIIKDSSGNTVAYIDDSGNLYLKGGLYESFF